MDIIILYKTYIFILNIAFSRNTGAIQAYFFNCQLNL